MSETRNPPDDQVSFRKGTVKVKLWDGTYDASFDRLGYQVAIDLEHHKVHNGEMYHASYYDNDVDILGPLVMHLVTGSKEVHIVMAVQASAAVTLDFYRYPTTSADGTEVGFQNRRQNQWQLVASSFLTRLYYGPTSSDNGTLVSSALVPGGSIGANQIGGQAREGAEWILEANRAYFVIITAIADDTLVNFSVDAYEETEWEITTTSSTSTSTSTSSSTSTSTSTTSTTSSTASTSSTSSTASTTSSTSSTASTSSTSSTASTASTTSSTSTTTSSTSSSTTTSSSTSTTSSSSTTTTVKPWPPH